MSDLVPVKRALLSVSDKTGLAEFATALHREFGIELISTGGTAKFLREQKLPVTDVSEVTGFPEMMDGRVKTLHPKVHGGLLALRDHPEHVAAMQKHDIKPIDLVCINLYPFQQTISKPNVTFEEAIENIDIGGPSMIRSAAKNHRFVLVVTSPDRYEKVLGDLREHAGSCCGKHRLKQAQRAFAHTAEYDGIIAEYLGRQINQTITPSPSLTTSAIVQNVLSSAARNDLQEFLVNLVTLQGGSVGATEAAAFLIEDPLLHPIAHVRPNSTQQERQLATEAFKEIISPCIQQNKNGRILIEGTRSEGTAQYCLINLLRAENKAIAVSAIIVRCRDDKDAQSQLDSIEQIGNYFDLFTLSLQSAKQQLETAEWKDVLNALETSDNLMPKKLKFRLHREQTLRYGENPHQKAALYIDKQPKEASVAFAKQLHGKELSYINLLDADAALNAVKELQAPTACIVKHASPCGYATADDLPTAFKNAYAGDPLAAFGGIVALNKTVDKATAETITGIDKLLEVIVAPGYDDDALELLRSRWKNVRLLAVGDVGAIDPNEQMMHRIVGGFIVQQRDLLGVDEANWKVVTKRQPTAAEMNNLKLGWLACKHVKSNAIVIAKDRMAVGIGGGQVDRVNAARVAVQKAGDRAKGAVAASDAFFPFPDGPQLLLDAGVTAIIQPGGAMRDQETIDAVNKAGAAMILTGQRHFRH